MHQLRRLVLRGDGNEIIGFGHIFRLLALADILKNEYIITFVIDRASDSLKSIIHSYVHDIIELGNDFPYTLPGEKRVDDEIPFDLDRCLTGKEIVVTDGYWFGTKYQQAIKNTSTSLVCIDDLAGVYFCADAVINHAPGVERKRYEGANYTKFYLGLDYSVLRKVFFDPFPTQKKDEALFISFGGSDHYNFTIKAVEQLILSASKKKLHILTFDYYSDLTKSKLDEFQALYPDTIHLYRNLNGEELRQLLDQCTHALLSASTILLECYSRGLICLTGFYTENQISIYNGFVKDNMAVGLGDFFHYNFSNIEQIMQNPVKVKKAEMPLNSINNIKKIFSAVC